MSLMEIRSRIVTNMSPRHREIMRRLVMGESQKAIAEDMGLTPTRISQLVNSPLFQAEMQRMSAHVDEATYDAMKALRGLQQAAVETIADSMNNIDLPHLAFKAAREVLDRTGVSVPKQLHVTQDSMSFEQKLQEVRLKYERDDDPEERLERASPIQVMGTTELLSDDEDEDGD